jgi:thiamine-phosphate pyrophosphorylase
LRLHRFDLDRSVPDGLDLFYPIVPDVAWLKRSPLGIHHQLRSGLRPARPPGNRGQLALCRQHSCQLIVNDYWRQALERAPTYHLARDWLHDLVAIEAGIGRHARQWKSWLAPAKPAYITPADLLTRLGHEVGAAGSPRRRLKAHRHLPLVAIGASRRTGVASWSRRRQHRGTVLHQLTPRRVRQWQPGGDAALSVLAPGSASGPARRRRLVHLRLRWLSGKTNSANRP